MLSLSFVFGAQDQLSLRAREEVVNASPRPLRRIEGQRGVYHRIVDGSGQILFENLVPDPRTVHWDTTDDGKTLRGGVVTLADQPLVLSLPAGVKGTLEVYLLRDENWARATLDKHGKLAGTFVVQ